jgi:CRP/FNR family cyclic AMP-dependent transcriptional regulator
MPVEPVFLKAIPLLRGFGSAEQRELANLLELVRLDADELIIEQGSTSGGFYFILDGQVKVSRALPSGQEVTLARMGKGHVVGFLTVLDGQPRSANVRTTSKAALAMLSAERFQELVASPRPVAIRFQRLLAREMIRTLRLANQRFTRAATLPPDEFLSPQHLEAEQEI